MSTAGKFILQTDSILNAAENSAVIKTHLCNRGILVNCDTIPINYSIPISANYFLLKNGILKLSEGVQQYKNLSIYSLNGTLVLKQNENLNQNILIQHLAKGIYIIHLYNDHKQENIKIILFD